jgi:phosphatidylinositol alpha-mannosyltransferase
VRIALVCPYAWEDAGGVQVQVAELRARLAAAGHQAIVIAPTRRAPGEPWLKGAGRPLNLRYNHASAPIDPRPWSRRAVREALDGFVPDVVHAHEPFAPSTSLWATLEATSPVVATFHSGVSRSVLYDLAAPLLRSVARRLSARIAVSERAAEVARARVGGAFEIVPNGVDVARFATAMPTELGSGTKLLFVGRLDERKGFRFAVAAFARLAPTRPDLRLVIAGEGPERTALDTLPDELRARVLMLGHVPNADLHGIHAACDVFLAPNVGGESFGVILIEAMAAGLPVVASDIPGFDEVIEHREHGLLVPARDPEALAAAAGRVLDDPTLAARLAAGGRERAAAFDWHVIVARLETIYGDAVASGGSR